MESGAGAITCLGPAGRVGMRLAPEAVGPGSSPDGDTRSQDKQPPRRVPNDAQQRGVSLAGQNHRDDSDRQVGEKNGGRKKLGRY